MKFKAQMSKETWVDWVFIRPRKGSNVEEMTLFLYDEIYYVGNNDFKE